SSVFGGADFLSPRQLLRVRFLLRWLRRSLETPPLESTRSSRRRLRAHVCTIQYSFRRSDPCARSMQAVAWCGRARLRRAQASDRAARYLQLRWPAIAPGSRVQWRKGGPVPSRLRSGRFFAARPRSAIAVSQSVVPASSVDSSDKIAQYPVERAT